MVKRRCPKCNAEFDRKYCYDRHINKKFDCRQIPDELNDKNIFFPKSFQNFPNNNIININNKKNDEGVHIDAHIGAHIDAYIDDYIDDGNFFCCFCSKSYSSKGNLTKHLKNCKIKKENDDEKENIFKLLLEKDKQHKEEIKLHKEEVNELKKQNKLLLDKIDKLINMKSDSKQVKTINNNSISNCNNLISNCNNSVTTNSNNSITNNQNNQNNFITVNFGKEDLSIIDEKLFIDRIIKKPLLSGVKIPDEVLKIIHFNPMYPQLSNIYISDINREKCMVFEDNEWKLSSIDNIPQIMDKICIFSSEQINTLKNKHPNNKPLQDRLNVVEKYNNMIDNDYVEDLKDNEDNSNANLVQRCEEFQKHTYNTFKKTLYHEGKKIKKVLNKKN